MMPMHNYTKTSGSLWQYYRDDPNDNIAESVSFKFKIITTGKTSDADNTKDVEIAVPLKSLSNFWRTLEMLLINWKINLILTWSADCVIFSAAGETKFEISDTKCYVPTITLWNQHNSKLLQQLKSGFQRNINWNKYQSKVTIQELNPYLEYLIDSSPRELIDFLFYCLKILQVEQHKPDIIF